MVAFHRFPFQSTESDHNSSTEVLKCLKVLKRTIWPNELNYINCIFCYEQNFVLSEFLTLYPKQIAFYWGRCGCSNLISFHDLFRPKAEKAYYV